VGTLARVCLEMVHQSSVTEEQIDHLGHMNVRWYAINATAASEVVLSRLGLAPDTEMVRTYTRHHNEQLLGAPLAVSSALLGGGERVRIYHELANRDTGAIAATFVHEFDHPAASLHADAFVHLDEVPEHGRARSLSLESDAAGSAPELSQILDLDIAVRKPRDVTTEDTGGATTVPAEMRPNLIWDGEPVRDNDIGFLRRGPNGENIGFATMESQLQLVRLPKLGMRIQSFGAVTELRAKTYTRAMWVFDVNTAQLLVAFEIVNLCFNIDERRSMVIPDALRAEEERIFHPAFAVT